MTVLSSSSSVLVAEPVDQTFSVQLGTTGATGTAHWSASHLPADVQLTGNGALSGTLGATDTVMVTLVAHDDAAGQGSLSVLLYPIPATVSFSHPSAAAINLSAGSGNGPAGATVGGVPNSTIALPGAIPGTAYSTNLWTAAQIPHGATFFSGYLVPEMSLDSVGVLAGTPTNAGSYTFVVAWATTSAPITVYVQWFSLAIAYPSPLAISTSTLGTADVGQPYQAVLQASGGKPAYQWTVASGTLPAGITLAGATGVLSGTPTAASQSAVTFAVQDATATNKQVTLLLEVDAPATVTQASSQHTWYVRTDGGTRYSTNITIGQCDGLADAAYPGTGVNQHCAFNDVRLLWQDGSYTNGTQPFPSYGWVLAAGDTAVIHAGSYNMGWDNPNTAAIDPNYTTYRGLAGNPYYAPPAIPSGTAAAPTTLLGDTDSQGAPATHLVGTYGQSTVLNLAGSSYFVLSNFDLTQGGSCGKASQVNACSAGYPGGALSNYANEGVLMSNQTTHGVVTNLRAHGFASTGFLGPTGDGMEFHNIQIVGNASSGWNADLGDGTTGVGSLLVQNFVLAWNGCMEQKSSDSPTDAAMPLPYADCTDQQTPGGGGYGDAFGTATVNSPAPGWQVHFDQGKVYYNTQDGLDALHLIGSGSSMTITRVLAYGNMGNQIKNGGAGSVTVNNLIVGNCRAMAYPITGAPTDYNSRLSMFCRAGNNAVALTVGNNDTTTFANNTILQAGSAAIDLVCDNTNGACGSSAVIQFQNNTMVGFPDTPANGFPDGSASAPAMFYVNLGSGATVANPFTNARSLNAHNAIFGMSNNQNCAAAGSGTICNDPQLTDESWHLTGYGNMTPVLGSSMVGAGATLPTVLVDYAGALRPQPPTIGALEPNQ